MKLLSPSKKIKLLIVNKKRWILKIFRVAKARGERRGGKGRASETYQNWNFKKIEKYQSITKRYGYACISAPEICSIEDAPEEFHKFISVIKNWRNLDKKEFASKYNIPEGLTIALDLTDSVIMNPAFALCLTAQMSTLERKNALNHNRKLGTSFVHKWNPEITTMLKDMGFFSLLKVTTRQLQEKKTYKILPYQRVPISTSSVQTDSIKKLMSALKALTGIDYPARMPDGLGEAMINVSEHAYPQDTSNSYFWVNAVYLEKERTVWITLYDLGQGIPESMRKNQGWRELIPFISDKPDHVLLRHASAIDVSSTKHAGRGNGIPTVMAVIDKIISLKKQIRIISGQACLIYDGDEVKTNILPFKLDGTFIEWKYKI